MVMKDDRILLEQTLGTCLNVEISIETLLILNENLCPACLLIAVLLVLSANLDPQRHTC